MIRKLITFCRTTALLGGLCLFLLTTTIGALTWGIQPAATLTAATSVAVTQAIRAANDAARVRQAKAVMKTKAKGRIRRVVVAIPLVGVAAMLYFEEGDFRDWRSEHPDGTRQQYGCEVYELSVEVVDDVLQDLPERYRPEPEFVLSFMPKCESDEALPTGV